jgi:hypothetical protein
MHGFAPSTLLEIWEAGEDQHPVDRALTLLQAGEPASTRAELAGLTVAERDRRLLRLRALAAGPELAGFAECPACAERLEFVLDSDALLGAAEPPEAESSAVVVDGETLRFRLPDSRDLAAAAQCDDAASARRMLAERCVAGAEPRALSEEAVAALAERMAEVAGPADVVLALACPACEETWEAVFDVASFFWTETRAAARRLLSEVDELARAYGWDEDVVLGLTPRRRQSYLDLARV